MEQRGEQQKLIRTETTYFTDEDFIVVNECTHDQWRNVFIRKIHYLMGAVMETCCETKSIIRFDYPMADNTLIDCFPATAEKGLLLGSTDLHWAESLKRREHLLEC